MQELELHSASLYYQNMLAYYTSAFAIFKTTAQFFFVQHCSSFV